MENNKASNMESSFVPKKKTFSEKFDDFRKSEGFYNYKKSKSAIIGTIIIIFILGVALIGPFFTVQDPYDIASLSLADAYKPPSFIDSDNTQFLLGTDQQGRDVLSAIVYGSRVSLYIGVAATIMASVFGITLGLIAGYFGGKVESFIMRLADIQLSFPSLLIALFLMTIFGRGIINILIALLLVGWVRYARTVRGATLSVKKSEYIEAARVIGLPNYRIVLKHILPNVLTSIVVLSTIQIGNFILTEATLSFLGLGVPVTEPSLGMLCSNGFVVLFSGMWWVTIFPGLYIMLIVFGINLLGDFLRDEYNPKLK